MTSLRISTALLFVLGMISAAGIASAGTVTFTYSGAGSPAFDPGGTATGSGSFTTDDANNPAGIGDLASFSFSLSVTYNGYTDTYTYALGDLVSFQADFVVGTLTDLTLTTDYKPAVYNYFEAFDVTGLGAGQAYTDDGDMDQPSIGSITLAPIATPEPVRTRRCTLPK